jgi:hypothetical protein
MMERVMNIMNITNIASIKGQMIAIYEQWEEMTQNKVTNAMTGIYYQYVQRAMSRGSQTN